MDVQLLKAMMKIRRIGPHYLSDKLGIDPATFYRRLQRAGDDEFSMREADIIATELGLTEEQTRSIFLPGNSRISEDKSEELADPQEQTEEEKSGYGKSDL